MKVLVCPLNWGLGHATRCIPIIQQQINKGNEVVLVADGYPLVLLQQEFPQIPSIEYPSYAISYSKGNSQVGAMLRHLPSIIVGIFREHKWLKSLQKKEQFDCIISDSRFGMWNKHTHSIYITHQLMIKMPRGLKCIEPLIWLLHRIIIHQYDECWVPDRNEGKTLSGDLAHKYPLSCKTKFVGVLSRFSLYKSITPSTTYGIVAILSGVEPQRSLLEDELMKKLSTLDEDCLVIRGLPCKTIQSHQKGRITMVSHLETPQLAAVLLGTKHIIARSGYSTIMDLEVLNCLHKAELIPTPGQTEQEYLAQSVVKYTNNQNNFIVVNKR